MIELQPLDIIACYNPDRRSRFASWLNGSFCCEISLIKAPSHLAVICMHEGKPLLIESSSATDSPCVITEESAPGCRAQFAYKRIPQYLRSNVGVRLFRLNAMDSLSSAESELLTKILLDHFVREKLDWKQGTPKLTDMWATSGDMMRTTLDKNAAFSTSMIAKILIRLGRLSHANPVSYSPRLLLRQLYDNGTIRFQGNLFLSKPDATDPPATS
jgi:hypothetical protein